MSLTPRQVEIAALVAKGLSNKAIARETDLSLDTVDSHLRNIANRVPGPGTPRYKALIFFLSLDPPSRDSA